MPDARRPIRALVLIVLACAAFCAMPVHGLTRPATQYKAIAIVDKRCGFGTVKKWDDLRIKLFADQDAVDSAAEIKDARALIQSTDSCSPQLPSCENSASAICDDRGLVFAEANLLLGQWVLALGFGTVTWGSPEHRSALGNYFSTAAEVCITPNVLKPDFPYDFARVGLTMALEKGSLLATKFSNSPVELYRDDLRTCAQRLGDTAVTF
jgi:hypothetical protein